SAHSSNDLFGECDPDFLVVDEVPLSTQLLDRRDARLGIARGVERQPVPLAETPVALGAELGPWAKEREVDVEENCFEHRAEDRARLCHARTCEAGGRLCRPRGQARLFDAARKGRACTGGNIVSPRERSGCPDLNWGPLRPERSALPGCATPRAATGYR